jgi:hypothetical protein
LDVFLAFVHDFGTALGGVWSQNRGMLFQVTV